MKTTLLVTFLAVMLTGAWVVYGKDRKSGSAEKSPATASTHTLIVKDHDGGSERSFEIAANGAVSLNVKEEENGKTIDKAYHANSWQAFQKQYPDVVRKYGIEAYLSDRPLDEMKAWEKETERLLRFPDFMKQEERLFDMFARPQFGIWIDSVDGALASQLGLKDGEGVLVRDVQEDSPAAKAGLLKNDVIVKLNGEAARGVEDMSHRIHESLKKGMTIEVIRGGKPLTVHAAPQ